MSILVVVAHPDDEVLGFGGTASVLTSAGLRVGACILSGTVNARTNRPAVHELHSQAAAANKALGMDDPVMGEFPNIAFNTVAHLELVQFIEKTIREREVTHLFTHHPGDLNDDHLHTSRACQAAARLSQRQRGLSALRGLYYMEILSSTDWAFSGGNAFRADTYMPIASSGVSRKLEALGCYSNVLRPHPHPRSEETVRALARVRGSEAGVDHAEAFQTAFRLASPVFA